MPERKAAISPDNTARYLSRTLVTIMIILYQIADASGNGSERFARKARDSHSSPSEGGCWPRGLTLRPVSCTIY